MRKLMTHFSINLVKKEFKIRKLAIVDLMMEDYINLQSDCIYKHEKRFLRKEYKLNKMDWAI